MSNPTNPHYPLIESASRGREEGEVMSPRAKHNVIESASRGGEEGEVMPPRAKPNRGDVG